MKQKTISLILILSCLLMSMSSISYAAVYSLTGGTRGGGDVSSSGGSGTNYDPLTGTRYAIRVEGEDGKYYDIGGDDCEYYYINHIATAGAKGVVSGNTTLTGTEYYFCPTIEKEEDKKSYLVAERAYMGTSAVGYTQIFDGFNHSTKNKKNKYYFFNTPSSSLSIEDGGYITNLNGVEQARHVVIWSRSYDETVTTSGFGLNDDDIELLITCIYDRAVDRKDTDTVDLIGNKLKKGKIDFQIRAEILMSWYIKDVSGKSGKAIRVTKYPGVSINPGSTFRGLNDSYKPHNFYTYRELRAIGHESEYYNEIATGLLYEKDEPWFSEYSKDGLGITIGFDYLQFENPYEVEANVDIKYMDINTKEEIISGESTVPGTIEKKDIDGYIYVGVQQIKPELGEISGETSIVVPEDDNDYEIIFWYKKGTAVTVTHKSEAEGNKVLGGPTTVNLAIGSGERFSSVDTKLFGSSYEYTGLEVIAPEEQVHEKDITKTFKDISGDGLDYELVFWYKPQVHLKTLYVSVNNSGDTATLEEVDSGKNPIPYKTEVKAKTIDNYKYLNKYEIRYDDHSFDGMSDEPSDIKSGTGETLNILESGDAPSKILAVFYYEADFHTDVEYIYKNPMGSTSDKTLKTISDLAIVPNEEFSINSINYTAKGYVNLEVKVFDKMTNTEVTSITLENFEKYGLNTYELKFTPGESNYVIKFYYTSQLANVTHQYADGNPIEKLTNQIIPDTFNKKSDLPLIDSTLNGTSHGKDIESITVEPISGRDIPHEVVFIYGEPDVIFDPEEETEENKSIATQYNLGVVPSNKNNQLVESARVTDKHWVLDESATLSIRYIEENPAEDIYDPTYVTKIKFPFDVYIDGVLYNETKLYETKKPYVEQTDETVTENPYMKIYELEIKDIYVPIWAEEGVYKKESSSKDNRIKVTITQSYTKEVDGVQTTDNNTKNGYGSVTVVGRIYDFSITNIEGDEMWRKSLFVDRTSGSENKEHEANTLPIGQGTWQNAKWVSGIMKGTKVYFSINTKGSKNTTVKIVPSFWWVDENGGNMKEVDVYSNGVKLQDKNVTIYASKNDYRKTKYGSKDQYTQEFVKATSFYTGITYTGLTGIGNYANAILGVSTRMPYLDYLTESDSSVNLANRLADDVLLAEASHWYGDYTIPNNAQYVTKGATYSKAEADAHKNGSLIVYFKIVSLDENSNEYLSYGLSSPKSATGASEWIYRRNEVGGITTNDIVLPITKVSRDQYTIEDSWLKGDSAAVIIYGNKSTSQNYESVGTH